MALVPLSYAGAQAPEANIGLMPALVSSYAQAVAWKDAPVGRKLTEILDSKGVVVVSWVWQAGGVASRSASVSSGAFAVARAHRASPVHAVTASELDSWLLPSAKGEVPEAQEWLA